MTESYKKNRRSTQSYHKLVDSISTLTRSLDKAISAIDGAGRAGVNASVTRCLYLVFLSGCLRERLVFVLYVGTKLQDERGRQAGSPEPRAGRFPRAKKVLRAEERRLPIPSPFFRSTPSTWLHINHYHGVFVPKYLERFSSDTRRSSHPIQRCEGFWVKQSVEKDGGR